MDVATRETTAPTIALLWSAGLGDGSAPDRSWPIDDVPATATVESLDGVANLSALVEETSVDCVLAASATGADGTEDLGDLIAAVREHDPDLPVVFAPPDPDPDAAATIAGEPATHYLPGSRADPEALAATIEDAIDAYDRHRQDAHERSMFREIMEMAPLSMYVKDEGARMVAASSLAEQVADGRVVGQTDLDLFERTGDESLRESYHVDREIIETGEPIENAEERVDFPSGKSLWLRTTKLPRRNEDDEAVGLVGFTRDVTPEKRREQELERESRRLEQFASFTSHDLRNPLMVAEGNLELARESDDPSTAAEHLDATENAIDRMERLIEDLLDIARPDEDRASEWTDLGGVAERAWTAVDAPNATLSIELPSDYEVRATSGALRQLLENVLGNAVTHGGADVRVEVGATDTGFYVADDGPGIPEDAREAVFEYGYTTGGSGIGLAITREIADAHGWTVGITESAAGGARFAFERCLVRRADQPPPVAGDSIGLDEWRTVGNVATGGVTDDGDAVTIRADGEALWGTIEAYGTYVADVAGGVRIESRVTGVESVHDYSKAGLLLADVTEPGSSLGFVGKTAEHGTEAAWRVDPGDPVDTHQAEPDVELPRWYRIDRLDDRVTFWASADGEDWTMVDRRVVPVADPVAVGLAVNSHEVETPCEATFENVRVVEIRTGPSSDG